MRDIALKEAAQKDLPTLIRELFKKYVEPPPKKKEEPT
jgi:hypothetical protein